ncbi:MAG: molybdate ABC transporter permease subunit [Aeromonas sp.]
MAAGDGQALWLTLKLASVVTLILLLLGTPLAWWLARGRSVLRTVVSAVVALPLVLPPSVLGFYLLLALAPSGALGLLLAALDLAPLAFSFGGLVLGSCLYSLPFMVQPLHSAFVALGRAPLEVAATLGAGPVDRFFFVALPQARAGLKSALLLTFAHTVGEFGVVLMLGGNIAGVTKVASVQLYDHVEALDYAAAHQLAAVLLIFSFALLLLLYRGRKAAL